MVISLEVDYKKNLYSYYDIPIVFLFEYQQYYIDLIIRKIEIIFNLRKSMKKSINYHDGVF